MLDFTKFGIFLGIILFTKKLPTFTQFWDFGFFSCVTDTTPISHKHSNQSVSSATKHTHSACFLTNYAVKLTFIHHLIL